MFNIYDDIVLESLGMLEGRLFKHLNKLDSGTSIERTKHILLKVSDLCKKDKKRWGWGNGAGRYSPVESGLALSLVPGYDPARIFLIDSATWNVKNEAWDPKMVKGMRIQCKSIRTFIPPRGMKTEHGWAGHLKRSIPGQIPDADKTVEIMISTTFDAHGMYDSENPFLLQNTSPRICLLFGNLFARTNRYVLMLRPNEEGVDKLTYLAYCFVVCQTFIKRCEGSIDLETWTKLKDKQRDMFKGSAIVTDAQLVVHPNNKTNFVVTPTMKFPSIHSPELFEVA